MKLHKGVHNRKMEHFQRLLFRIIDPCSSKLTSRFLSIKARARRKLQLGFSEKACETKDIPQSQVFRGQPLYGDLFQSPFSLHFTVRDS